MVWGKWRERLAYTAMSLFVAWHGLATMIAPAPEGSLAEETLRSIYQPYLSLLKLDNTWDFFAPTVGLTPILSYTVEAADQSTHEFRFMAGVSWFDFLTFSSWQDEIVEHPRSYGAYAAIYLCNKHAALKPVAITLKAADVEEFTRDDWLEGKRPFDPEFLNVITLNRVSCPTS